MRRSIYEVTVNKCRKNICMSDGSKNKFIFFNQLQASVIVAVGIGLIFPAFAFFFKNEVDILYYIICSVPFVLGALIFSTEKPKQKRLLEDLTEKMKKDEEITVALGKMTTAQNELRFILDSMAIGIWKYNPVSLKLEWDQTMHSLYGKQQSEFTGQLADWVSTLNPDIKERTVQELNLALHGKKNFNTTFEIITKSGEHKFIGAKATIVRNKENNPAMVYGINWDRTAEEKQIRSINSLTQQSTNISHFAIFTETDTLGVITYLNENTCKISGYTESEIRGKTHKIFGSNTHSKEFWEAMWRALTNGQVWRHKIRNKRKDGTFYWLDSIAYPVFGFDGKIEKFQNIAFDITREMAAEEALEIEREKAAHLGRLAYLGEVAGGIAHEINNPLAIIEGHLCHIDRMISSNDIVQGISKLQNASDKCHKQVQRISKIISGLRQFARKDEFLNSENLEINVLLSEVSTLCEENLKHHQIKLTTDHSKFQFHCVRIQIEQVLVNLVRNSIDAIENLPEKWIHIYSRA